MTTDFICRLLCALMWMVQGPLALVYLKAMLTPAPDTPHRRRALLFFTLIHVLGSFVHYFAKLHAVMAIQNVVILLTSFYTAIRFYHDRFTKKFFAITLIMAAPLIPDMFIAVIHYMLYGYAITFGPEPYGPHELIISTTTLTMCIAFQGLICILWCRFIKQRRILSYSVYLAVFFLLGVCMVTSYAWARQEESVVFVYTYLCVFMSITCGVFVLVNQVEKEEIGKELEEVRRLSELERIHYEAMEVRQEELAKIRHDCNNVLTSVLHLVKNDSIPEAVGLLSQLTERIDTQEKNSFCGLPVVNAVLAEKQRQLKKSGLGFYQELQLPEDLAPDKTDLCSALSHLVNLAAEACEERSTVSLTCRAIQGYWVFKCSAPSHAGKWESSSRRILEDVAARYHGDFFTEYRKQTFTAQLSLPLPALLPEEVAQ